MVRVVSSPRMTMRLARRARMIRDHGSERRYCHDLVGFNGRLDEIQARRAAGQTAAPCRLECATPIACTLTITNCSRARQRRYAGRCPENKPVYHLYVIGVPRRDELQTWLKKQGISTRIHYPVPIHLQPAMRFLGYTAGDLLVTEHLVGEILSLPMYAELTDEAIEYVADSIRMSFANVGARQS